MVGFIDAHRDMHWVEPICSLLPIAPSTYYDHLARRSDPTQQSIRARRDEALRPEIRRVFEESYQVCGVRKVWRQLPAKALMSLGSHRRQIDEGHEYSRHYQRQAAQDDDPGQKAALPTGQGEPPVPGACPEHVVGSTIVAPSVRAQWMTTSLMSRPGGALLALLS